MGRGMGNMASGFEGMAGGMHKGVDGESEAVGNGFGGMGGSFNAGTDWMDNNDGMGGGWDEQFDFGKGNAYQSYLFSLTMCSRCS